jgi:hypothetical protein
MFEFLSKKKQKKLYLARTRHLLIEIAIGAAPPTKGHVQVNAEAHACPLRNKDAGSLIVV